MAKCLLISGEKNLPVTVEKGEGLENQPGFSCDLSLSASSESAHVALDPHLTPKALGALRPFPSLELSENIKKTWVWKTWIWKTDFPFCSC